MVSKQYVWWVSGSFIGTILLSWALGWILGVGIGLLVYFYKSLEGIR